ncbi:hypothetical protein B296_00006282 [Ensete ventricosum]|uniref:AB hydrolase-1 domain-containing protein n=1 Tax=Ensete ventricosum TaxID=4639 RepID=A0A427AAS6_ENSVE|nr:hypothetical protein B296_00006282 [Ensete ventricosum]
MKALQLFLFMVLELSWSISVATYLTSLMMDIGFGPFRCWVSGSYFVATVAGLWPSLVKSLVLINTAGSIVPTISSIPSVDVKLIQSFDPGAAIVLESIVSFDLSIPLNYLLGSFGGEVLIIQGMKDPLTKSKAFLSMVREHCNKVTVSELDAGNWFNHF